MLTKADVDAFLSAEKRVRTEQVGNDLPWQVSGTSTAVAVLPVETEDGGIGTLRLIASYLVWRDWKFVIQLEAEQVLAWHFDPNGRHPNKSCPTSFPSRVRTPHEHVWVDGHDLTCALPLEGVSDTDPPTHRECLDAFCERTNLKFEPRYVGPPSGEQMILVLDEGAK